MLVGATALTACGGTSVTVVPRSELPDDVFESPTPARPEQLPNRGTVYLIQKKLLVGVPRRLPDASSLPEALLEALLTGPSGPLRTAIPENTRLISLNVNSGGVAAVNLSSEFERSAPGRQLALRVAQVVYTVTESPEVIAVRFSIEGTPAGVIAGEDQVVIRPVTREDYLRYVPPAQ